MSIAHRRLSGWRLSAFAVAIVAVIWRNGLAQGESVPEQFNIVSIHITSAVVKAACRSVKFSLGWAAPN